MQAAPLRATTATAPALPLPSVTGALRAVEAVLMRGGQRTARRNAWTSVLEDRRRAKDRHEAEYVLEAAATSRPHAT
ncbi:SCO2195 family GlnR-regulated protein [Streptomyces sp. bgisy084]|uniref:SCO2195 family GlnR-regulated protein n=1 Tax=unclassified Streptomyces TaxID=2593676 RepID=UPI003D75AE5C